MNRIESENTFIASGLYTPVCAPWTARTLGLLIEERSPYLVLCIVVRRCKQPSTHAFPARQLQDLRSSGGLWHLCEFTWKPSRRSTFFWRFSGAVIWFHDVAHDNANYTVTSNTHFIRGGAWRDSLDKIYEASASVEIYWRTGWNFIVIVLIFEYSVGR